MKSRAEKYLNEDTEYIQKRTSKNQALYEEMNDSELKDITITSNARVIGENEDNSVNVDKIKEILEKNYHDIPKRSTVKLAEETQEENIEMEETREYDINAILERAREEKEIDYDKDRLKKIRDTQYDILKNLDFPQAKEETKPESKSKEELLNLINTITENELQKTKVDLDPLDILTDLKGDDNTVVIGSSEEPKSSLEEAIKTSKIDDSFYTNSLSFSQSDFDDFNDLKDQVESNKVIVRVLIVIVAIAIIVGIVFFLNNALNLGLF